MGWMQEIEINDHGVRLPTHGKWVDIPGSPFQVITHACDPYPTFLVRIHPEIRWSEWESFDQRAKEVNRRIMKGHPMAEFFGWSEDA